MTQEHVRIFVEALRYCVAVGFELPGRDPRYDAARDRCHALWAVFTEDQRAAADALYRDLAAGDYGVSDDDEKR